MSTDASLKPMMEGVVPVIVFTLLYMAAAVIGALSTGNAEFLIYIGVMIVLIGVVGYVHYRVRLTKGALWALSIWGALHMAGGLVPLPEGWAIKGDIRVLYSWWRIPDLLKYDHVVHAYGFAVTTWVCWQGLKKALRTWTPDPRPSFGLMVLCAMGGMGFGGMNEVIEFTATLLVPETNVGGYVNTGWDLVSNLTGSVVAATLIWATERNG